MWLKSLEKRNRALLVLFIHGQKFCMLHNTHFKCQNNYANNILRKLSIIFVTYTNRFKIGTPCQTMNLWPLAMAYTRLSPCDCSQRLTTTQDWWSKSASDSLSSLIHLSRRKRDIRRSGTWSMRKLVRPSNISLNLLLLNKRIREEGTSMRDSILNPTWSLLKTRKRLICGH